MCACLSEALTKLVVRGSGVLDPTRRARAKFPSARVKRIREMLMGKRRAASVLDVEYVGKAHGTLAEEALMAILRIVTDAKPG